MFSEIKSVIEKVYLTGDYDFFISQCQQKIDIIDKLLENSRDQYKDLNICDDKGNPSVEIFFELDSFSMGEFKVKYTILLLISKICDVFYLQHEFAVDNLDSKRMSSVLDGFGDQAYNRQQYDLDNMLTEFLKDKNYKRLKYSEMEEVITTVSMPKDNIFGSQMTVENAIFKDTWNICSENDIP